jgi:hypothetical protein
LAQNERARIDFKTHRGSQIQGRDYGFSRLKKVQMDTLLKSPSTTFDNISFGVNGWLFGWKTRKRKQAGTRCSKRLKIGETTLRSQPFLCLSAFGVNGCWNRFHCCR